MDPNNKQLNQLDPKLKEAYDRVMGTDLSANIQAPSPVAPPPPPPPNLPQTPGENNGLPPLPQNPSSNGAPTHQVFINNAAQSSPPPQPSHPSLDKDPKPEQPPQVFNASAMPAPATPALTADPNPAPTGITSTKSSKGLSTAILLIAGVIFFLVYAVLWGKILGLF